MARCCRSCSHATASALQLFAGAAHQDALLLQRAYQLKNTADIVDGRPTELFSRDGIGTQIVMESAEQIRRATINDIGGILEPDQVAAPHAAAAGLHRPAQEAHGARVIIFVRFQLLRSPPSWPSS
jgi:hypothetical protein